MIRFTVAAPSTAEDFAVSVTRRALLSDTAAELQGWTVASPKVVAESAVGGARALVIPVNELAGAGGGRQSRLAAAARAAAVHVWAWAASLLHCCRRLIRQHDPLSLPPLLLHLQAATSSPSMLATMPTRATLSSVARLVRS